VVLKNKRSLSHMKPILLLVFGLFLLPCTLFAQVDTAMMVQKDTTIFLARRFAIQAGLPFLPNWAIGGCLEWRIGSKSGLVLNTNFFRYNNPRDYQYNLENYDIKTFYTLENVEIKYDYIPFKVISNKSRYVRGEPVEKLATYIPINSWQGSLGYRFYMNAPTRRFIGYLQPSFSIVNYQYAKTKQFIKDIDKNYISFNTGTYPNSVVTIVGTINQVQTTQIRRKRTFIYGFSYETGAGYRINSRISLICSAGLLFNPFTSYDLNPNPIPSQFFQLYGKVMVGYAFGRRMMKIGEVEDDNQ
jgi:hypothetical protein